LAGSRETILTEQQRSALSGEIRRRTDVKPIDWSKLRGLFSPEAGTYTVDGVPFRARKRKITGKVEIQPIRADVAANRLRGDEDTNWYSEKDFLDLVKSGAVKLQSSSPGASSAAPAAPAAATTGGGTAAAPSNTSGGSLLTSSSRQSPISVSSKGAAYLFLSGRSITEGDIASMSGAELAEAARLLGFDFQSGRLDYMRAQVRDELRAAAAEKKGS
jgi:hypothetical protein